LMLTFFLVWDCLEAFLAFREGLVARVREMMGKEDRLGGGQEGCLRLL